MNLKPKMPLNILYIGGDHVIITQLEGDSRFNIFAKENNFEAIQFLTETNEDIDGILCEMYLPGLNGFETHRLVESEYALKKTPFILIHHELDPKINEKAIKNQIDDVYLTPLNNDHLFTRINYLKTYKELFANNNSVNQIFKPYKIPLGKRIFDIILASVALLGVSPILLLTVIAIRLESKGKVYYISKRVGTGYKVFDFYKLRSMSMDADKKLKDLKHLNQYEKEEKDEAKEVEAKCSECEKLGRACSPILYIGGKEICENLYLKQKKESSKSAFIKIVDDPRITKVGKFIRKTSIDELPQLINVLKGDMSIVGNRPLPLYEAEQLTSDGWSERFLGPAGITGLWQVNKRGKSTMSEEERKDLDNQYARNHSFWGDIMIILRTIPALFQKENV